MRIARFKVGDQTLWGTPMDELAYHVMGCNPLEGLEPTEQNVAADRLLAPIEPYDILCIGLNYRDHASETGATPPPNPMLFIKARSSLNHPNADIVMPHNTTRIDCEAELAVVIKKRAHRVSKADAMDYVLGYTCANDVSARDWQKDKNLNGGQFARGKSFPGFCPIGPFIVTPDEVPDPHNLRVRSLINGEVLQDGTTADMIFDIPTLISSLSETLVLEPGSIILTGTPAGVGDARTPPLYLKRGDTVTVEIEKVGTLTNKCV